MVAIFQTLSEKLHNLSSDIQNLTPRQKLNWGLALGGTAYMGYTIAKKLRN